MRQLVRDCCVSGSIRVNACHVSRFYFSCASFPRVFRFSGFHVFRVSGVQVCLRFSGFQVFRFSGLHVFVFRFSGFQVFRFACVCLGFSGFQVLGFEVFRSAGVCLGFSGFRFSCFSCFSGSHMFLCVFRFSGFQVFRFACVRLVFSGFYIFRSSGLHVFVLGFQVFMCFLVFRFAFIFWGGFFPVFRFSGLPVRCLGFQACSSSGFLVCMCLFVVFRFSCLRAGFQVLRVFQVFRFSLLHGFEGCILHVELLGRQADLVCN